MKLSRQLPLNALRVFEAVAQRLSFTKAAEEVGVSRAALSQNLKSLEKQLGAKLLYRTTRDMSLTEAGRQLLESVGPALQRIDQAVMTLEEAGSEPAGLIRLNT